MKADIDVFKRVNFSNCFGATVFLFWCENNMRTTTAHQLNQLGSSCAERMISAVVIKDNLLCKVLALETLSGEIKQIVNPDCFTYNAQISCFYPNLPNHGDELSIQG